MSTVAAVVAAALAARGNEGSSSASRPQSRCQTEHRRRRLHQLIERESLETPVPASALLGVKSLPSLHLLESRSSSPTSRREQQQQRSGKLGLEWCPSSPVRTKCKPNLSPLKTHRPHLKLQPQPRQATSRTARRIDTTTEHDKSLVDPPDRVEQATGGGDTGTIRHQIAEEAALARKVDDFDKRRARLVAKQYKAAQLEQMQDKQQRRRDLKLEGQQIAEQIEWEQTQVELAAISHRVAKQSELYDLKECHLRALEIDRRRASASKIATHFFERLAALEATQAMELFESKQEELVRCCMELMQDFAERDELDLFKEMMRELLQKEGLELRHRLRAAQREQEIKTAKAQAVVDLKRSQFDEIQRHAAQSRDEKVQQRVLRQEVTTQQRQLDDRYSAQRDAKKQRDIALSRKLQEQMRRNRAEHATVSLQIDGKASPLLWTPFWSDDSTEARAEGYLRPSLSAISPERPVIFAKQSCQWYD